MLRNECPRLLHRRQKDIIVKLIHMRLQLAVVFLQRLRVLLDVMLDIRIIQTQGILVKTFAEGIKHAGMLRVILQILVNRSVLTQLEILRNQFLLHPLTLLHALIFGVALLIAEPGVPIMEHDTRQRHTASLRRSIHPAIILHGMRCNGGRHRRVGSIRDTCQIGRHA